MRDSAVLETVKCAPPGYARGEMGFTEGLVSGSLVIMVSESAWMPPTDVFETATEVMVKMELAGVNAQDIDIKLDGRRLIVTGRRVDSSAATKRTFRQLEINYGRFERIITFGEGTKVTTGKASYKEGFLLVTLPKVRQQSRTSVVAVELES
jgi:HSP20 family protein